MPSQALQKLIQARQFNALIEKTWLSFRDDDTHVCADLRTVIEGVVAVFDYANQLIAQDADNKPWVANQCSTLFGVIGRIWDEHCKTPDSIDVDLREQLQSTLSALINLTGVSSNMKSGQLIGIDQGLDQLIVDQVIRYHIAGDNVSTLGEHKNFQVEEHLHDHYHWLLKCMVKSGSIDQALDLYEAIDFIYSHEGKPCKTDALFNLAIEMFDQPIRLQEDQKERLRTYLSRVSPPLDQTRSMGDSLFYLLNLAESGLEEFLKARFEQGFKSIEYFTRITPETLLLDIERLTGLDVSPMLIHWAGMHSDTLRYHDMLLAVIGYQLMTSAETIQENLLDFQNDKDYLEMVEIVRFASDTTSSCRYVLNSVHLRLLLAEFMAQRPNAIKAMGNDELIGHIASKLPGWYVDQLETDLGL